MLNEDAKITEGRNLLSAGSIEAGASVNPISAPVSVRLSTTNLKPLSCCTVNDSSYPRKCPGQFPVKMTVFGNSLVNSLYNGCQ